MNDHDSVVLKMLLSRTIRAATGCLEWQGATASLGRGLIQYRDKLRLATRVHWTIVRGEIPEGLLLCHKCDNHRCVELDHLFLGTHSDNLKDCVAKGRHPQSNKTHCPHGHPYSPENTMKIARGDRVCRTCDRQRTAARRKKVH